VADATPDAIDITTASLDDLDPVPPKDPVRVGSRPAWNPIVGDIRHKFVISSVNPSIRQMNRKKAKYMLS